MSTKYIKKIKGLIASIAAGSFFVAGLAAAQTNVQNFIASSTSSTTPGIPNTGIGTTSSNNTVILVVAAIVVIGVVAYFATRRSRSRSAR